MKKEMLEMEINKLERLLAYQEAEARRLPPYLRCNDRYRTRATLGTLKKALERLNKKEDVPQC